MCLSRLFKKKEIDYQPISSKKISIAVLSNLLKAKFHFASLYLSDNEYTLCHYDDIAYFLAINEIDKLSYKAEDFDCDDSAAALWGEFSKPPWSSLAIGLVWTEVHALNCLISEDNKILFIEPQTDEILTELKPWMGNQVRLLIL